MFVVACGGAGFHIPDPALTPLTQGRGVFFGECATRHYLGHPLSPSIDRAPGLLPQIFNGDPSAVCVRRGAQGGQGQGIPKITPGPRLFSLAGRRKVPGAGLFQGPVRPVTNSTHDSV